MVEKMRILKKYFPMSAKGWLIYFVAMGLASALCALLQRVSTSDVHVPMIFVLMVLIIALMTDGYFYGFLAAVTSVIAVNWAFTYPYAELNFSIYGYPLTFVTMLAVGFAVSTLAARVKEQNRIKLEAEQEKMRANLLRAISHDLRTPLTSISGAISAVLDSGDSLSNAQRLELLSDARKDAEWLCRMVENLLSITRISGDKPSAIKKEDEVLEEVLSEVVVKFRKKNPDIAVSVTVPDDLFFVPMDAMLVEQLLMNLMDNAVQHGGKTSRITINATKKDNFAEISVCNDGHGIPPSELDHLFDGSLQLCGDKIDKTRNMGIGLMVCKTIAVAHGGKIWAQNLPCGGAEFTFSLQLGEEKNEY